MASKYTDESDDNTKLINNYWDKYYSDKDKSVTPYSNALKKPQEGMHVNNAQQQQTITALAEALKDNDDTIIAATDATNSADFVKSYNQYPQAIKDLIDQYNVHAYSDGSQMQSRDIAQADGKKLSMSEVDGSWHVRLLQPVRFRQRAGHDEQDQLQRHPPAVQGLHLLAGGRGPLQHADGLEREPGR